MTEERKKRLAKIIAHAGVCSRREAEKLIAEKRVTLNGKPVTTPATLVGEGDVVAVDGEIISEPERARLWLYHKPKGLVTTHKDPQGRPTVFDALPKTLPRVISVGRLDLNSEGLLLLTNDGGLARHLELPSTGWVRRYRVRIHGRPQGLERLKHGITVEGVAYAGVEAEVERQQGANCWLRVGLKEGKNREIRKIFEHLGYPVNRLIRVAYGPFQLGTLPVGEVREVSQQVLREQLGDFINKASR